MNSGDKKENEELKFLKKNDLVPLEELVSLNSDVKDIIDDADYTSEILDLEHQLAIVKAKELETLTPVKYDKSNELETKTPFTTDEVFRDYIEIRDSVRATNKSLKDLIATVPLEGGMLKPIMLQTIAQLYRTLHSNMKLWMQMHKDIRNNMIDATIQNKQGQQVKEQHNTFNFTGTTSDIIDKMKNGVKNVTGIESADAEIIDE